MKQIPWADRDIRQRKHNDELVYCGLRDGTCFYIEEGVVCQDKRRI